MTTYKVIQDIEAEDKLVGPLTLRQFIYAGVAALSGYLGFLTVTKGAPYMLAVFAPVMFVCGFFAFPWRQDQPTEVWALAKVRFMLKPRKRMWDQSGTRELVTVTAPRTIDTPLTNGLGQDEVHSRLSALASTLDSRGWAVKNVNVNLSTPAETPQPAPLSDRLVQASTLPQALSSIDVKASDDILDGAANPVAHNFENMINNASATHHQQLIAQMQQPTPPPALAPAPIPQSRPANDYWFMSSRTPTVNRPIRVPYTDPNPVFTQVLQPAPVPVPAQAVAPAATVVTGFPVAAAPTPEEEALVGKLKAENESASMTAAYGHMKTLRTPAQLMDEARKEVVKATIKATPQPAPKPKVTPTEQAAIINLANNDDLDVATIARQVHKQVSDSHDGEVVISLR